MQVAVRDIDMPRDAKDIRRENRQATDNQILVFSSFAELFRVLGNNKLDERKKQ